MNKVQAQTKQADTKKANVSTANTSNPTKEVETMNTATAQATVKTSDVAKNPANIASNKEAVKQTEQPKADNKMNTVANNTYQNAKDGVKVEDTKAAAPVAPKTEQTNSTIAVKEEQMTEAKLTYQQIQIKIADMASRYLTLTTDEEAELVGLKKAFNKLEEERKNSVDELKSIILSKSIQPTELFNIAVLKEAVGIGSSKKKADNDGEEGGDKKQRSEALERPSDSKPLLIEGSKPTQGRAFKYRQGRIYEVKDNINKTYKVDTENVKKSSLVPFPTFFNDNKTESDIRQFLTKEGEIYFNTVEGKKELQDILAVIKMHLG